MKLIKLNYDWMLLDVSIPAESLDEVVLQQNQYAPDGKILQVFFAYSGKPHYYKVFAYTFVDKGIQVQDNENYQEDINLIGLHFKTMFNK